MIKLSDNQREILYSVISAYASSGKHKTYALVMGMKLVKTW